MLVQHSLENFDLFRVAFHLSLDGRLPNRTEQNRIEQNRGMCSRIYRRETLQEQPFRSMYDFSLPLYKSRCRRPSTCIDGIECFKAESKFLSTTRREWQKKKKVKVSENLANSFLYILTVIKSKESSCDFFLHVISSSKRSLSSSDCPLK